MSASPAFEAKYHLLAHTGDGIDHYDIIWGVRCAVTGCLPTRSLASPRGKALLLQLPSFQGGACERDVEIVIEFLYQEHLALRLPEEFDESIVLGCLLRRTMKSSQASVGSIAQARWIRNNTDSERSGCHMPRPRATI